jgi:hypothetical protein
MWCRRPLCIRWPNGRWVLHVHVPLYERLPVPHLRGTVSLLHPAGRTEVLRSTLIGSCPKRGSWRLTGCVRGCHPMRRLLRALACVLVIGCSTVPADPCGDLIEDRVLGRCVCPPDTVQSDDGWSCLLPDGGTLTNPMAPDSAVPPDASVCSTCDADHCIDNRCVQCTPATEAADCDTASAPVCSSSNRCVAECDSTRDCIRFARTPSCAQSGSLAGQCVACSSATECSDPSAPVCDPTTGTCVDCLTDDDCVRFEGRSACSSEAPRSGRCVECTSDDDCSTPDAAKCDLCIRCTNRC